MKHLSLFKGPTTLILNITDVTQYNNQFRNISQKNSDKYNNKYNKSLHIILQLDRFDEIQ